jgi:hypothetical protein
LIGLVDRQIEWALFGAIVAELDRTSGHIVWHYLLCGDNGLIQRLGRDAVGSSARCERDADQHVATTIHVTRRTNVHRRHAAARERVTSTCGRPEIGGRAGLCVHSRCLEPSTPRRLRAIGSAGGDQSPAKCRARLRNRHDAQRAPSARPGFSMLLVSVPRVRGSVIARSGDLPVEFDDSDGLKNRRRSERKSSIGQVLISRTLSVYGEVAERLKAAVC